jgi:cbb3-type cytochrome oxidase maturation protein
MNIIVLLILISVVVALTFLGAFYWAVKSGQFDDTDSPAVRMLLDDKGPRKKTFPK